MILGGPGEGNLTKGIFLKKFETLWQAIKPYLAKKSLLEDAFQPLEFLDNGTMGNVPKNHTHPS